MRNEGFKELFRRYEGNPILIPENWPYKVGAVFNPGAIKFDDGILLLVRVEDKQGYSHLTIAKSRDGKTDWQVNPAPALTADSKFGEHSTLNFEKSLINEVQARYLEQDVLSHSLINQLTKDSSAMVV